MKNVLATGVFFCSMLGVAAAQTSSLMTVKLPNAVMVGATNLPAGDYTIREVESNGNGAVIQFSDVNGVKATVFAQEIPGDSQEADHTSVILKSDGERLQVDKLWVADHGYGFQIIK